MRIDKAAGAELTRILSNPQTRFLVVSNRSALIFPPVTHNAAKDAFVDNVEKLKVVMPFPTWPQSSIFVARRHKTIQQTQPPQRISLPSFHNECNYMRKIALLLQLGCGLDWSGVVLNLHVICSELLFRVNSGFLWPSTGRAGKKAAMSLSQGLQALSQLNPHQGKHSLVFLTSPNQTHTHTHTLYTQQSNKCVRCCRETIYLNAHFVSCQPLNKYFAITVNIFTSYNVSAWHLLW